ncbi:MAG: hypothetical protein KJ698_03295 [Actinobacteria bacterium]|nr:hypothetical protein [Actinomycetota bacterium]
MEIREVLPGDRRGAAAFERYPSALYRGHPRWVPPIRGDIRWSMDRRRHPFYRNGDTGFFLAERDGRVVGRIAVIENRSYNEFRGRRDAFFYYFDADNDPAVAAGLIDEAAAWARRHGLTRLVGPKGLLPMEGFGVLIEGFEHPPALGVPYNHPYYQGLLEGVGFSKETDFISGRLSIEEHFVPEPLLELADAVAESAGYAIKTFESRRELRRWIPRIAATYNRTFTDNWEFWPLSDEEALAVLGRVAAFADPGLVVMLMCHDELVGHLFIIPNVSQALRKTGGRLWPFGWVTLLRERATTTTVDFLGIGLVPEHRGTGANAVIYARIGRDAPATRFRSAEIVQIDETNAPILSNLNAIGATWHKRHRIYQMGL